MHPFVKWAGGKSQLLEKLKSYMPEEYDCYYEPFIGGGALLFSVKPNKFVINDFNSELVQAYRCFTDDDNFNALVDKLKVHEQNHSEEYFYKIREMDKDPDFSKLPVYERAARMIYLNKACFNGLYRVNSKGFFNVPSGKKKTVNCFEESNINEIREFFKDSDFNILNGDFEDAVSNVRKGDFVYFDPPYDTWDDKDSFTSYAKNPFGKEAQRRLADVYKRLSDAGAYVMLSNHNTAFIQELYKDFHIHIVNAKRMINSNPNGRGDVEEVIITNYE